MESLIFCTFSMHFFISFKYVFHVNAERMIVRVKQNEKNDIFRMLIGKSLKIMSRLLESECVNE